MAKLILIDHSLTDMGGHYYEYAVRVLQAAAEAGYTPVLATNRLFEEEEAPWEVWPVYEYGFWGKPPDRKKKARRGRSWLSPRVWVRRVLGCLGWCQVRLVFSPVGLIKAYRQYPPEEILQRLHVGAINRWTAVVFFLFLYCWKIAAATFRLLKAVVPCPGYVQKLVPAVKQFGRALFWPAVVALPRGKWIKTWRANNQKAATFGRDTLTLFTRVALGKGDLVLIPTLAEPELMGLVEYFRQDPRSRQAHWHLIFRRHIYQGREPEYGLQDEKLRPLRNALRFFQENLTGQTISFFTDTDQLTAQYNRLGVARFRTLPIPVRRDYYNAPSGRPATAPMNIIYVGDARPEKGYQHLPVVVQDLWLDYVQTRRVHFTLHSYYNCPEGEPAAVVARAQLQGLETEQVRLILEPLDTEGYRDLVLSGDLCLILYDREQYYARSSGIFAEAMVAGIPVVVPAGTWMAMQLSQAMAQYHAGVRQQARVLQTHLGRDLSWQVEVIEFLPPEEKDRPRLEEKKMKPLAKPGKDKESKKEKEEAKDEKEKPGQEQLRRWAEAAIPPAASHLLLSCSEGEPTGSFVEVQVTQVEAAGDLEVSQETHILGGRRDLPLSLLVPRTPSAGRVRLSLQGAFAPSLPTLADLRLEFLQASTDLPRSTVGMVYSTTDQISACVREIIDHRAEYQASARKFAADWAAFHNPHSLLRHLQEAAPAGLSRAA
ncbi:MAG: glycosyltransferase [Planctomycetes bacterium]|nr:glycosyltransferase [Planctomycetota bacterium]